MGARRQGRILAIQALYSYEMSGCSPDQALEFSWLDEERKNSIQAESLDFGKLMTAGALENLDSIDRHIKERLEHWDFDRINKVDLAILRISVYCLLFQKGIPATVTIDEAIDISKKFGTDDSYRFVNGVLDGIYKQN
jgi:N utilization substance protein B